MKLTTRTIELFDFICEFKKVNGYSPTAKEIAKGLNTKSKSHIEIMLDTLEDLEYIKIIHRKGSTNVIKVKKFISEKDRK